ncbi:MAG: ATP-dependent zinc metalloprotease FtsH [Clostridia bacterium]
MKKKGFGAAGFYLLIIVVFFVTFYILQIPAAKEKKKYSDVITYFQTEQVQSFKIKENVLEYKLQDGTENKFTLYDVGLFLQDTRDYVNKARENGTMTYDLEAPVSFPWWVSLIPYLIIGACIIGLFYFMYAQMGSGGKAMSFGKAKVKMVSDDKKKITFKDVAGADEEKGELEEVVDFLKNPKKYIDIGARIPKGVLLVGPPGTGKTLLAKAVAGESGTPFFSISGSDFVELYVGVGASRVRDLFEQAKKVAPSIIFIDEIDAVGRQRGAGLGGGHDEREQTLNQLLVEMDGFGVNEGVIIIAATNRADILDSALLRPGRFDRQIMISYPDINGREAILKIHAQGKKFANDVNFNTLSKSTAGFSGADLENILNESALHAARRNGDDINMQDIEDAVRKITVGVEKKSRVVSPKARKLTAYHEAGHAIVTRFLPTQDKVHEISIVPRGMAGGYTLHIPSEEKDFMCKNDMQESIGVLLGGRVAEKLTLDDISTGASNDIERASAIARKMITKFGMSEKLGPIVFGNEHDEVFLGRDFATQRGYSENIASIIDEETRNIIDDGYRMAENILTIHMDKLHELANLLLTNEKISGVEFEALFTEPALKEEKVDIVTGEVIKSDDDITKETAKTEEKAETLEKATIAKDTENTSEKTIKANDTDKTNEIK